SVVLPVPGGPHKIKEGNVLPLSIKRRNTRPLPTRCSWPTNSLRVRGRIRSASGAAVAELAVAPLTSDISGNRVVALRFGIVFDQPITTSNSKASRLKWPDHCRSVRQSCNKKFGVAEVMADNAGNSIQVRGGFDK